MKISIALVMIALLHRGSALKTAHDFSISEEVIAEESVFLIGEGKLTPKKER